ncbi:MAG: hypothetical protein ACI4KR_11850 [Ruminiclostridium sp.]
MELFSNEFLFYGGIIAVSVGALAVILLLLFSVIDRMKLNRTLEKEYGARNDKKDSVKSSSARGA